VVLGLALLVCQVCSFCWHACQWLLLQLAKSPPIAPVGFSASAAARDAYAYLPTCQLQLMFHLRFPTLWLWINVLCSSLGSASAQSSSRCFTNSFFQLTPFDRHQAPCFVGHFLIQPAMCYPVGAFSHGSVACCFAWCVAYTYSFVSPFVKRCCRVCLAFHHLCLFHGCVSSRSPAL
jgi:hypothetical protein